jgi:predicted RNase H-like nuclease (RuvC/YqgF family)
MKTKKTTWVPVLYLFLVVTISGCLPGSYYGGENRFGDKWEAVFEKDAPAETLFSRFHRLKQLSQEERGKEYEKALARLEKQPDVFWRMETVFLAILTGHCQKGAALISELKEELETKQFKDDFELKGVVGLLELLVKQRQEINFLRKSLEDEKEQSDKLAHQLKELKNIEKIIHERETNKENE